jgi:hypothetical protein
MQQLWLLGLISCILASSSTAVADGSVKLSHNGEDGVWFPSEMAGRILADAEEVVLLRKKVSELEDRLSIRAETIESLKAVNEIAKQLAENADATATTALKAQQAAVDEAEKARASKNPIWKHPVVWFVVGAICTVGLEVAAVKVIEVSK